MQRSSQPDSAFPITTTFTYDSIFNQVTSITDPNGNTTTINYDAKGNPTQIIDALGNETRMAYDMRGLLTSVTDVLENTTSFAYNDTANLIRTTDPLGNVTTLAYDAAGNVSSSTDAEGRNTRFSYDVMNRLVRVTDANSGVTDYDYDSNGNLIQVTDAKENVTTFEYDARDRLAKTTDPLGNFETFAYDGNGNLISTTDRKKQTITFAYDAINQLVIKTLPGNQVTTFAYDDAGNLTLVVDPDSRLAMAYDAANRLISASTAGSPNQPAVTINYTYDRNGNRLTMTDDSIGTTSYVYDELSRLTSLTNPSGQTVTFDYDSLSRRTRMSYPNGVITTYAYDIASQLTSLVHRLGANTISSFDYTYDRVGNRDSLMTTRTGLNVNSVLSYTYDKLNRLVRATHPLPGQPDETFTYDPVGNRLRRDGQNMDAIFDAANRLLADEQFNYAYDDNGNLIEKIEKATGTITRYAYDAENQLIQIQEFPGQNLPPSMTANYHYDGLGRRIAKNVDGVTTSYVYDREDIVLEFSENNGITSQYTQGIGFDEPLTIKKNGKSYFYHADGLGNITDLSNGIGAVAQFYAYDSFGRFTQQGSELNNPYIYTAREFDLESEVYYLRARYYDPDLGRFYAPDPFANISPEPSLINSYAYVENNPITRTDPTGKKYFTPSPVLRFLIDVLDIYGNCCGIAFDCASKEPDNCPTRLPKKGDALDNACAKHDDCMRNKTGSKPFYDFGDPKVQSCHRDLCIDASLSPVTSPEQLTAKAKIQAVFCTLGYGIPRFGGRPSPPAVPMPKIPRIIPGFPGMIF